MTGQSRTLLAGCLVAGLIIAIAIWSFGSRRPSVPDSEAAPASEAVAARLPEATQAPDRQPHPRDAAGVRPASNERAINDFLIESLQDAAATEPRSTRQLRAQMLAEELDPEWDAGIRSDIDAGLARVHADFGEQPDVSSVECRQTLCQVMVVTPASLSETPGDWLSLVNDLGDLQESQFVSAHSDMRTLPDGRTLYITFLVR